MKRLSLFSRLIPTALLACGLSSNALAWQASDAPPPPGAPPTEAAQPATEQDRLQEVINHAVDLAHAKMFECDPFPSAKKCAACHPTHFREWAVSPHSYAQLSPVFLAMSNKLQAATSGTQGDFCIRCHTPAGLAMGEDTFSTNLDRHPSSREGVTCVVCHRVNQNWGKGSGRLALVAGGVNQAVYGPLGSEVLEEVLARPSEYGVLKTSEYDSAGEKSRDVHGNVLRFFQMGNSSFCGACHDVFAPNGFRLEDAFSEFKSSPAALEQGLNCQDCHMGHTPGKPEGYTCGPVAVIGGNPTRARRVTNHMMAGPDYSIIHRGLYPHHLTAIREEGDTTTPSEDGLATMREWLQFNDYGGWGTERFETSVSDNSVFPGSWQDPLKRKKARLILNDQSQLLKEATTQRLQVLRAGYFVGDIEVEKANRNGLNFVVPVSSITTGHGIPTGFDAERIVFLRTVVFNGEGRPVFMSGDLDPNGDIRDSHSAYVHDGKLPLDRQIFTLQTRFITRNVRGGEREQVLPVPYLLDPLPFIRPETRPFTVFGRPVAARKHKQNIEPCGSRDAHYEVSRSQMCGPGPFTIRTQLIAGMVPPNLIHAIQDVGFDYGLSGKEVADRVVQGHLVLYDRSTSVNVD